MTTAPPPTTENCRFCWMCRHVCPVGHVTHRETFTPHAWALTIESVKRGQLAWNGETASVMYACADCGLCRAHCVTDQPLPDAITAARAAIVTAGAAPAAVYDLDVRLRTMRTSSEIASYSSRGSDATAGAVALFVGEHGLDAPVVLAALRLLNSAGVPAVPIGAGRSTGLVANSVGLTATARLLAEDVVADVVASGAIEVLVLSPGDRWTFEYVYPVRLGVAWPATVNVREVADVLAAAKADGRFRIRALRSVPPFAYHDPCHTPRVARGDRAVRSLLDGLLGADARRLFWREHRAHPCGAIGGLELTHPEIAAQLGDARLADARTAGAEWLVTEDPVCAAHLAARGAAGLEVKSLYELLDAAR